jgi:hypothetical protein
VSDPGGDRRARIQALWVRYLAGEATTAPELLAEVRAGGELAPALAADAQLHRLLDALGRSHAEEAVFVEQVGRLVAAEASVDRFVSAVERQIDAVPPRPRPTARLRPARRPGGRWLAAPLALAAAAAAAALWLGATRRPSSDVVARGPAPTTLTTGLLQAGGDRLRPGQLVPAAVPLVCDEGRACLRLGDGSQLCMERGTRLQLDRPGRPGPVVLEAGKVAATVRHQPPGATFAVSTAAADVTAIGTAFTVEVTEDGRATIARVVEGTVAVSPPGRPGADGVRLSAHQALSASGGARWRMSSEEEREEWSLVRAHTPAAFLARPVEITPPTARPEGPEALSPSETETAALLRLGDALRARGRLSDAQGIIDGLARRLPGRSDIERLAAEVRAPPPAQPWNATPAVYRINAGGGRYMDPRGNIWSADIHYSGGHTGEFQEEIDGTDMDPIYRSERFAFPSERMSYHLPVADGQYVVRLHFAEIWAGTVKSNMRQFDVIVEGQRVLAAYDIAAEVGSMTATVKQLVTSVRDGNLDIDFAHVVENPKVSAIEVFALGPDQAPPPPPALPTVFPPLPLPPTDALYRVNAGGREYVDSLGRRWEADNHFNDSGLGAAQYVDIAGTDLDPLYQTERRSFLLPSRRSLVYSFPAPPGRYLLRLHFVELGLRPAPGGEVFDVLVEKAEVLRALDIFAEVGPLTALVKEVETTALDGAIDLSFRPRAGRPKIAAIEVIPLSGGQVAAPVAGCAQSGLPARPGMVWLLAVAIAVGAARRWRRRAP